MNRVYLKCPQCQGKECSDCSCKFTGRKHKDAARRGDQPGLGVTVSTPATALEVPFESAGPEQRGVDPTPTSAVAAPDIGYECAWPK